MVALIDHLLTYLHHFMHKSADPGEQTRSVCVHAPLQQSSASSWSIVHYSKLLNNQMQKLFVVKLSCSGTRRNITRNVWCNIRYKIHFYKRHTNLALKAGRLQGEWKLTSYIRQVTRTHAVDYRDLHWDGDCGNPAESARMGTTGAEILSGWNLLPQEICGV